LYLLLFVLNVLAVEGKNDCKVAKHLMMKNGKELNTSLRKKICGGHWLLQEENSRDFSCEVYEVFWSPLFIPCRHLSYNFSRRSFLITLIVELSFLILWTTLKTQVHFWNLSKLSTCVEGTDLDNLWIFQSCPTSFHWDIKKAKWKNVIPSCLNKPWSSMALLFIAKIPVWSDFV
jgi:hypothetical protein